VFLLICSDFAIGPESEYGTAGFPTHTGDLH